MDAALLALPEGATVVGEITDGDQGVVTILDESGAPVPPAGAGWDHFAD